MMPPRLPDCCAPPASDNPQKLAGRIEAKLAAAKQQVDLTQAVLAKAFRGEPVPTEAELARREDRDYAPGYADVIEQPVRPGHVSYLVCPIAPRGPNTGRTS
jgi:hypothetical protein